MVPHDTGVRQLALRQHMVHCSCPEKYVYIVCVASVLAYAAVLP